jgi:predicted amidohydrolase
MNCLVGDLTGNAAKILEFAKQAKEQGAQLLLTPELALSGYPPEDLLLNPLFVRECRAALHEAARRCVGIDAVVGFPEGAGGLVHNAAALLRDGTVAGISRKTDCRTTASSTTRYFARAGPS